MATRLHLDAAAMEQLLPYFERELARFRHQSGDYAARYPRVAGRLQAPGERCGDPHVERMIEAFALIAARIVKNLDDDYQKFTESFLELLYPHYLRQFPSCAIARLASQDGAARTIARGAVLDSAPVDGVACRFRTAYALACSPLTVSAARFAPLIDAPGNVQLPPGAGAAISITIAASGPIAALQQARLRLFIDGEASFCAALRDALFMRTLASYVETEDGAWRPLAALPLHGVGYADDEALIPSPARSHPACRLLAEYFCFPDKFNFIDIDLAALALPPGCRQAALHLALGGVDAQSNTARMLAGLSAASLLSGCTPVVNLFAKSAVPISLSHTSTDCTLVADASHAHGYEVYSIDSAAMLRQDAHDTELSQYRPFYSLRHGEQAAATGRYWVARRDRLLAARSPGHEMKITFIDIDFDPLASEHSTVSLELTCSNRGLPTRLGHGLAGGDLLPPGADRQHDALRFLRRPSAPLRIDSDDGTHWRLLSQLALNQQGVVEQGVAALRDMLALYDLAQSPASQCQIGAILALEQRPATAWVREQRGASLVDGVEVRLCIDEAGLVGSGLHLFAQVVARYLALSVQVNSFAALVLVSAKTGEELLRCPPSNGDQQLA